ncbi:hypothetical protein [Actinomadura keratinilytica]|jgi:hypothetical protein|uniref:Uncharacterized protein n=2 Tax=Actinomadura keratinilytica TaxID=547461 RepID=A0ABP7Y610_9ACTN
MTVPAFARGLCDDAAVFPPGSMPLPDAVPAHRAHKRADYAELVGSFVVAAPMLDDLRAQPGEPFPLIVTAPAGPRQAAAAAGADDVVSVEVAVPAGMPVDEFFAELRQVKGATVVVEVPRDERRPQIVAGLAGTDWKAKFRTGGVRAEMYPDEAELAAAIKAVVDAGVPFKATAGLHHAVRNTDPETGFEQHGFLNVLLAVDDALAGRSAGELARTLGERDGAVLAERVRRLDGARVAAVRSRFLSFGTCSIAEPLTDLVALGLLPAALAETEGVAR